MIAISDSQYAVPDELLKIRIQHPTVYILAKGGKGEKLKQKEEI